MPSSKHRPGRIKRGGAAKQKLQHPPVGAEQRALNHPSEARPTKAHRGEMHPAQVAANKTNTRGVGRSPPAPGEPPGLPSIGALLSQIKKPAPGTGSGGIQGR